ncbi:MAG TPA: bifunctional [glutamine synthetase] adenylyltransferase/[glutamine synthetase]-adenylyl-L-tyrosine phosphorylase [Aliidongia sp.]|nr:bifunctional [glutamine synthetase] adenylyltransferase/[glutamine synthetase]-adenylyl-L-tyrosine phosphorylase [Aliidongia sp.]
MDHTLSFVAAHQFADMPAPADRGQADIEWERWRQTAANADPALADAMHAAEALPAARRWLDAIFGNSPYLTRLALRDPAIVSTVMRQGPDHTLAEVIGALNAETAQEARPEVMSRLRRVKRQAALIIAMADIGAVWPLDRVTRALSDLADAALGAGLRYLLRTAASAGQITLAHPDSPERESGVFILGMGKLGAHELNYSSDIDLIILFDTEKVQYHGRDSVQGLMARLARDLVKLLEERTADGYVFRTDLRLRPDPASTPPAVSVAAAEGYYGSLGQNWERAALIKARPVAGDLEAGRAFLAALTPFLWRKHLDFAAIRDIHSIKRQINARHGGSTESIAGHNIKLGHGGIREIEFFAQTQQLIWGGRLPSLRSSSTIETLFGLVAAGRIERRVAEELAAAYGFLRRVEHRLQMIEDSQTHTLPQETASLNRLAIFLGYADQQAFAAALIAELTRVQRHFGELFRDSPPLSAGGNLVFTGKEPDPETLATLRHMGFKQAERVAEIISGWHRGWLRATRSLRAREILTELVPSLLRALGRTADPDFAFTRFDEFLSRLPAGVQLLSLFQHRPELLGLVAEIMGEAPLLAVQLARRPLLLDAVLTEGFFASLPKAPEEALAVLAADLELGLGHARHFEDLLDLTRRWASDRRFQIGVQLLQGRIDGDRAGRDFTLIAETAIAALAPLVQTEFARSHGVVPGASFAILGLGKLGSREMNALSDLDLIFIYRAAEAVEQSDGPRPLPVISYFARLSQRIISALAAMTGEGVLYEVDMRLRPSGNAGPIASSLESFRRYHEEDAWTWERMALTRARVITGDAGLGRDIDQAIRAILTKTRDPGTLLRDVADMRRRIAKAHHDPLPWDCKHRRGALVDLEFIAQYLALEQAPRDASVLTVPTSAVLERMIAIGRLDYRTGHGLIRALESWHRIQQILRVRLGKVESEPVDADLIDRALAHATGLADPKSQHRRLARMALLVLARYQRLIDQPAGMLKASTTTTEPPLS